MSIEYYNVFKMDPLTHPQIIRPCDRGTYLVITYREHVFSLTVHSHRAAAIENFFELNTVHWDGETWEANAYKRRNPVFEGVLKVEDGTCFDYFYNGNMDDGEGYEVVMRARELVSWMKKYAARPPEFVPIKHKRS